MSSLLPCNADNDIWTICCVVCGLASSNTGMSLLEIMIGILAKAPADMSHSSVSVYVFLAMIVFGIWPMLFIVMWTLSLGLLLDLNSFRKNL